MLKQSNRKSMLFKDNWKLIFYCGNKSILFLIWTVIYCQQFADTIGVTEVHWCDKTIMNITEIYEHGREGVSAHRTESPHSRGARAQGRWLSVRPSDLPSSGRYALFFYCHHQPESQQKLGESSPSSLPLPSTSKCDCWSQKNRWLIPGASQRW